MMESRGNAPGYAPGGRLVGTNLGPLSTGAQTGVQTVGPRHTKHTVPLDLSDDFHVYGLIWNETYIGTYLDTEDQVVLSFPIKQSSGSWVGGAAHVTTPGKDVEKTHLLTVKCISS